MFSGINSMALFVIVCLLFVFGALLVYAAILLRKKRANTRLSRMRNGSFWFAYLFPFDQLTAENRNMNSSSNRKVSDDGNTSRNTNTSFSEEDEDDVANVSVNPAGSPTFGNHLQPPSNLPPPPPPLPTVRRSSPVFPPSSSATKRPSLATLSGLIPPPQPPNLTEDELLRPGYWHDKETDLVDKIFLFLFPMLFIAFNGLYWPFLINEGKLFNH